MSIKLKKIKTMKNENKQIMAQGHGSLSQTNLDPTGPQLKINLNRLKKCRTVLTLLFFFISSMSYGILYISNPPFGGGAINTVYYSALSPADKVSAASGIVIYTGGELVVDETIDFDPNAQVIVHSNYTSTGYPGGRLIIREKMTCSAGTWQGIKVQGSPSEPHFNSNPDESIKNNVAAFMGVVNYWHGLVDIQEGTIIEKAEHGIWSVNGGIVQSFIDHTQSPAEFIDCQESIYIEFSAQSPSASRINRCNFSWTDPNIHGYTDYTNFRHVTIKESKDIRLGGCDIVGEYGLGVKYNTDSKGIGVLVTGGESTYSISEAGNTFAAGTGSGCIAVKYDSDPTGTYPSIIAQLSTGVEVLASDRGAVNNTYFFATIIGASIVGDFVEFHDNFFRADDYWMANSFNLTPAVSSKLCIELASVKAASMYRNTFSYHNFNFGGSPWPAFSMVYINGFTGGEIKVVDNTFNGNVTNTLETKYALTGGGNLTNFEWRCNTFNDFETAVSYGGTGPALNPANGGDANNTYNNISNLWIINNSTVTPVNYYSPNYLVINPNSFGVNALNSGETPDCSINCTSIQTKYKHSPTASIESAVNEGNLAVYPNPSSGSITVDFGEGKVGSLTIYNAQGQQVQQASIASGVRYEASKSLPAGLYFIEVLTGGDKRTSKLIISK